MVGEYFNKNTQNQPLGTYTWEEEEIEEEDK